MLRFTEDTYVESYIATIGVDFVRIDVRKHNLHSQFRIAEDPHAGY